MIFKFQQGGELIPPLVSYTPVTVSGGPQAASAGTSETKSQDLTDKDMLTMLKDLNGLPNDMQAIQQALQNFYIDKSTGFNTSNIATKYLQILTSMKTANFNKQQYDEAFNIVKANGGLNEIAINDRGQVFCMNNQGDFQLLSPEEIKGSGYAPLTNSELLQYRAHSPEMAYKNNILKVVSNGIGMEAVTKMLQETITNIGNTSNIREGYAKTEASQLLYGLEQFMAAAQKSGDYDSTINNLYKGHLLTEDQATQAQQALFYLYRTLPENARTLLKTKTQNGTDAEVIDLVSKLLSSKLSTKQQFTMSLETPKTNTESKESQLTPAQMFQLDRGIDNQIVLNAGTADALVIHASMMPISKKTGDLQGVATLDKVANDSQFGGLFNFNQVSMGDQLIDMGGLKNIVVNANQLYKAYLPIDQEKAQRGIIAPNTNYLKTLEWVRNTIKERNAQTPEEINAIYEEARLPKFVDENGKVIEQYYKPFGVLNASAFSEAFKEGADLSNNMFEEITDKNEANNILSIIHKNNGSKDSVEWDPDDSWIFEGSSNAIVKGLIFLPLLSTDPTLGAYSSGQKMTNKEYQDIQARVQAEERQKMFKEEGGIEL